MIEMSLTHQDWGNIHNTIEREKAKQGQSFVQGRVTKRDEKRKLVWIQELGDQPIPIIGFEYDVKVRHINAAGQVVFDHVTGVPKVPRLGQVVLVALHLNSQALPKCLGVIHSHDYAGD